MAKKANLSAIIQPLIPIPFSDKTPIDKTPLKTGLEITRCPERQRVDKRDRADAFITLLRISLSRRCETCVQITSTPWS